MNVPLRVVIADDHPLLRAGLRALLSLHADLAVVAEASDGQEAIALWHETQPDVGLFDLRMPLSMASKRCAASANDIRGRP